MELNKYALEAKVQIVTDKPLPLRGTIAEEMGDAIRAAVRRVLIQHGGESMVGHIALSIEHRAEG